MVLAAATTVLALLLSSACAMDVAATCKAGAERDVRVNLPLCVSRLGNNTASNTLGLAKVAVDACITSNLGYRDDLLALSKEIDAGSKELHPLVEPLTVCSSASSHARISFDEAKMEIKERKYPTAMEKLDEGMQWTKKCNAGLTAVEGTKMPEPLGQHLGENVDLAIIAKAITSLVN